VSGQKPSLGRIVLVPTDPSNNNGATAAPAIITRVWNDDTVNVRVFSDSHASAEALRTSATLVDELPGVFTDPQSGIQRNVWCWPPRV
jgi:hypothetical protein